MSYSPWCGARDLFGQGLKFGSEILSTWSHDPRCWELLLSQQVWRLLTDDAYEARGLKTESKVSADKNEHTQTGVFAFRSSLRPWSIGWIIVNMDALVRALS